MDLRNGNWDIYLYDLKTGTERQITTEPEVQSWAAIDGNYIVWTDNRNDWDYYEIYLYDLKTGTERQITTDPAFQEYPAIDGNNIVWMDLRNGNDDNGNWDIYLYDLKGKK